MRSDLAAALAALAARAAPPLHVVEVTTSTNDLAKQGARDGAPHGAAWVAEAQTQGRGRQGRTWTCAPGDGLLVSVLVRLRCPPSRLPPLAIAAGLAVRDALARAAPRAEVRLKWPNDVVVGEARKKLAGLLLEAAPAHGDDGQALVVGVGVNVHTRAFPEELAARATSLALVSPDPPDRGALLVHLLDALASELPACAATGLAPFARRLEACDALRGARVAKDDGEQGIADGIDGDGRLVVRRDDGARVRWSSGEAHLVEP